MAPNINIYMYTHTVVIWHLIAQKFGCCVPDFSAFQCWFQSCCVYVPSPGIQTEEMKVKKSIKDAAKRGQVDVAKILAKEVVQSKKAVSKLYASKAQMNSVVMSMQQQLGQW